MNKELFHPVHTTSTFVSVILPIAAPQAYTYSVPEVYVPFIKTGLRVEVQFGRSKLYSALVIEVLNEAPENVKPKPILSIIDDSPIVNNEQIKLWQWISKYYGCSLGEVMIAALPSSLRLASETRITLSPFFDDNFGGLNDKEFMITEALTIQNEISLEDVRKILGQKTIYPLVNSLLEKKIIYLKEEMKSAYKPKTITCVRLQEPYHSNQNKLEDAFDLITRSQKQAEALMAYIQLSHKQSYIRKQDIYNLAKVNSAVIKALVKKGIFELYDREVSRLAGYEEELIDKHQLSQQQETAIEEIKSSFEKKNVVLLHGVTGSGKTRVYLELIQDAIKKNYQVLYLLPEIALTTQIIQRVQKVLGDDIAVYHSRLNNNERVELWKKVLEGKPVVLGARSAMFLPFKKLRLIIIDEEHDKSYKQHDPAPRYSGRDAAIYMAQIHGAKVLLGTATPSIESYFNAKSNKYGLVNMPERFGGLKLPEMIIVDQKEEMKKRTMQSHFTSVLINELKQALTNKEQAILFQNRRGYAPVIRCNTCGWSQECNNCDVSMSYHQHSNNMRCHYCGSSTQVPTMCPACGDTQLTLKGYGTEKIEDELKIFFPEARIARMDLDTVRGKNALTKLINDFEEQRIDILIGTQMVTKGLDFDNVGIVGVLSADHLFYFPDFRASERAYQLLTQVSGRAGRKHKQGKVVIQAYNTVHPVLKEVLNNDFQHFYTREINERQSFNYPPYHRLIKITLKHKKPQNLNDAGRYFTKVLKSKLGDRVIGPAIPNIPRVRSYFLLDWMIKLERDAKLISFAKQVIKEATTFVKSQQGCSMVRISVDVDPY